MGRKTRHARILRRQYVCSRHFSATDFTLAYETYLDRYGVPNICTAVSHPQSAKHREELSLNSSSSEDFHFLVATKTYSTKSITSLTNEPLGYIFFVNVYIVLFLFDNVFYCYDCVFSLYIYDYPD